MEAENKSIACDIASLREEINQNELIIENYLKTANNMKHMAIGSVLLSIFFFTIGSHVSGFLGLFLGFLCVRKYNRSVGMAEVYNGVTKFLKFMLRREVTGDTSLPGFLE